MSALRKQAAQRAVGMPPPPSQRPPPAFGGGKGGGGGAGVPAPASVVAAVPASACFDTSQDVDVGGGDTFRVYSSAGPADAAATVLLLHGAGTCALSWGLCAQHLRQRCGVVAFDMRGHGATLCSDPARMSAEQLCADAVAVAKAAVPAGRKVVVAGHSLGGATAVRLAQVRDLPFTLAGCVVVDVVEGTALDSLRHMHAILSKRPTSFTDIPSVIRWGVVGSGVRNIESAKASMPEQVVEKDGRYVWRVDLLATEPHWEGWFKGLSDAFLASPCPKLLMLAGTDRLDKALSIGHMQGKFQLAVVPDTGHFIQEDKPEDTAEMIVRFCDRFTQQPLKGPPLRA